MNRCSTRLILAGFLAAALVGATASRESAQAMPLAPAPSATDGAVTTVQYYPYGYRGYDRPYRRYYGYRYRRHVGRYGCGPYQLHTHLQRKACR